VINKECGLRIYASCQAELNTFIDIDIDIFINCSWVVTRWQYTFTHKQYIE